MNDKTPQNDKNVGKLFIISAPSGAGKNTLLDMLKKEFSSVKESISYTTRSPRGAEVNGKDYFFISDDEFERRKEDNDFLEYATVYDKRYGTSKSFIQKVLKEGKDIFLVIDTQGAEKILENKQFSPISIFILPPSIEELKKRLVKRGTDSQDKIETRLEWAQNEIKKAPLFQYRIINDDIKWAYKELRDIYLANSLCAKKINDTTS